MTLEDIIRQIWGGTPALASEIPSSQVFVGFPSLRKLTETREIKLPLVLIKDNPVNRIARTSGKHLVWQNFKLEVVHTARDSALKIANDSYEIYEAAAGYSFGDCTLNDLRPAGRTERQESDGVWLIGWQFAAQYTRDV